MNILVAGGAGMVGSHVVDAVVADGHRVIVLDNFATGSPANLAHLADNARLTLIAADLAKPLPPDLLGGRHIDRIYHLASPASPVAYLADPIGTLSVNAIGTTSLLDLAHEHGARFLLASTSEVYGDPLVSPQPETYWGNVNPIGPRSCYDEGKRYAEALTIAYHRMHELDIRIARIFNSYGPRSAIDDGRVIPNFCVRALRGEPLEIAGDGAQTRSFCYIDDLIEGLRLLMETDGLTGEAVNLGNPEERTITEVAELIVALAKSASGIRYRPLPQDDPLQRCPDIAKATRLLGWQPQTTLVDGLNATIASLARVTGT